MKYDILLLGKTKENFLSTGIQEYLKRLKHYTTVTLRELKPKKVKGGEQYIKDQEAALLLDAVKPSTYMVALDERGRTCTSREFAEIITKLELQGVKHVSFLIGGPLGLSSTILERARLSLSLSQMTFTHDMVRLFLLEQLYRAYTIKAGEKYHK